MNQDVKKRWIEALRSGEFKQTKGVLLNDDGAMCCLGVLCELHRREVGGEWKHINEGDRIIHFYLGERTHLMPEVCEWAGLHIDNVCGNIGNQDLISMNDTGASFEEIADIIEKES